ncbi:PREDICTED: rho GTPase-activating protein gacU-like [Cyphomyrmex costatus]|uniref:rho GTPase-activating protein gacU-like n=1 Tax=Cyphomyrmex costatus TaxID=456900 RepID=UPI00085224C4|nr:PREDICTED: rho GTPase-activating protein gacU-like [Cyphomyrmex costatus]
MSKKTTINRLSRRHSKRKSIDSIGSGHLDPNTSIMDEEQTFWWNDLEENTFSPHSMIRTENETAMQLSSNSRVDSTQNSTTWWKNLESPNKATASTRRSAAVVKNNILQSSTSESEKEFISRKKKINLKANSRKSINNAFANALNDTEVIVPLKLRMKQVDYELHSDSDSKSSQEKLQENKEDSNLNSIEKIFKSKRSIFRPRRGGGIEDQNAFQDILTKDVLNSSTVEKSIVFEKESSKRSMDRNINVSKDHIDDHRKSIGAPQTKPLENIETDSLTLNVEKAVPETNADSSQSSVIHRQYLKPKSRFMQKARKSIEKNAFADALADSNSNSFTSNPNKENNIDKSSMSRSLLSPLKRSVNLKTAKANIDIMPESSPVRKSPRLSSSISKEQQSNLSMQAKNNTETNFSSSSLDSDESHGPKRSIFFKPKSKMLEKFRKRSTNPFEEIVKLGNISDRRSNVSIKSNRASFKRETTTTINRESESLAIEEDSQSVKNKTMSGENSFETAFDILSNVEKSRFEESNILSEDENELLENNVLKNASKSISRKNITAKLSEEKIPNRKSISEKTLKGHEHADAISPVDKLNTNEMTVIQDVSDNSNIYIDVEHDSSTSISNSNEGTRLILLETSKLANIEVHEDINNSYNNINKEHDSDMLKQLSKSSPSKKDRLTNNSLRNRSETAMNIEVHEVNGNLHDASTENNSSMLEQSKLIPSKAVRLTRNSLRTLSEISKPANIEVHKAINNSRNDTNKDRDSNMLKSTRARLSKLSRNEEPRLTRNSLRNRSETPVNIAVHKINDNLHETSREHDSSTLGQSFTLTSSKARRLTRNSSRTLLETSKPTNVEVHEDNNSYNNINKEHDLDMLKQLSKSSPSKKDRLTHNSLRNRSETAMNVEVHEVNDNLHDASTENNSSMLEQSKLTPSKAVRLTRNSLRTLSKIPKPANIEVHEAINNSRNNTNKDRDSNMLKSTRARLSKLSRNEAPLLTRNSLRNRSETPVNIGVHKINDNLHETSREHDSSTLGQSLTPSKAGRLTRNSSRTLLETSKPANVEVHEDINNSYNNINKEHDSDMLKQLSKSSPTKKDRLTHNGSRNQSETLKSMNKTIEVYERSMNLIPNNEEDNNVETLKTSKSGPLHIITREEIHSKDNTNTGTQKSTSLSTEMEMTDGEDAESAKQTIQQNSLTKPGTSKTVNWQSVQSSSRTNIMNNREIAHRQKSLDKSQNDSIPTKSSSKDISSNKQSSSKSVRKIDDFFKVKETAMEQSKRAQKLQVSGNEKMKNLKMELEEIKSRRMAAMKMNPTGEKKSAIKPKRVKLIMPKRDTKKKKLENSATVVDKAFLVNGKVYKPPRLPRPKHWVTNRLYKFLWKRMESKYKLSTRVKSEKFMQKLVETVATVERCKNYEDYDTELEALMKEMARLKIINNRMDFYHFCQDFLPYDFRIKAIPMLLPGNKINIPYNPENVYIPLLDTNEQSLEI